MTPSTLRVHGIRYQTRDLERAIAFYTKQLGFELKHRQGSAFASVACDGLDLLLSGPGSSGARDLPGGEQQLPGGWNRLVLAVSDLPSFVAALRESGNSFRSDIVSGPGGRQIQLLDPDGNPVELFEPAARPAQASQREASS
jgi:glyoxylase I family protein